MTMVSFLPAGTPNRINSCIYFLLFVFSKQRLNASIYPNLSKGVVCYCIILENILLCLYYCSMSMCFLFLILHF